LGFNLDGGHCHETLDASSRGSLLGRLLYVALGTALKGPTTVVLRDQQVGRCSRAPLFLLESKNKKNKRPACGGTKAIKPRRVGDICFVVFLFSCFLECFVVK
jgi:hypothetical protein